MATGEGHWTGAGGLGRGKQPGPSWPGQERRGSPGNEFSHVPASHSLTSRQRGPLVKSNLKLDGSFPGDASRRGQPFRAQSGVEKPKGESGGANRVSQPTRSLQLAGPEMTAVRSVLRGLWHLAVEVVNDLRAPSLNSCHRKDHFLGADLLLMST